MSKLPLLALFGILTCLSSGCKLVDKLWGSEKKLDQEISWVYGGYDGSKTVEIDKTMIKDLVLSRKSLSYSWAIPESEAIIYLGSKKYDTADLYACFFVANNNNEIVGGKFEWISISRKSRDLENIFTRYNGWNLANVPSTTKAYFCIVNPNTGKRTNFIEANWVR